MEKHSGADAAAQAAMAVLESVPWPVWVCRRDGWIDYANAAGRSAEWPLVADAGRLVGRCNADSGALRQALQRVAEQGEPCTLALHSEGGELVSVRLVGLGQSAAFAGAWPESVALLTPQAAGLQARESGIGAVLQRLAERFSLTRRETIVLGDLAQGLTVAEIAERRHVEPVTVRTHLRSLFDKTEHRRQAELVRLVVGG
jgi:DNA-binding CsgD family transcriptional regulator